MFWSINVLWDYDFLLWNHEKVTYYKVLSIPKCYKMKCQTEGADAARGLLTWASSVGFSYAPSLLRNADVIFCSAIALQVNDDQSMHCQAINYFLFYWCHCCKNGSRYALCIFQYWLVLNDQEIFANEHAN